MIALTPHPDLYLILVDDTADAAALADLLPGSRTGTFDAIQTADDDEAAALAVARYVVALVPGDAGPAIQARARDAVTRLRDVAESIEIHSWEGWKAGAPFRPPGAIDSAGTLMAWLVCLPELPAATGNAPAPKVARAAPVAAIPPERESQAESLIRLASVATLYHAPDGRAFAAVEVNGHQENHEVRSRGFKDWLTREYFLERRRPPSKEAVKRRSASWRRRPVSRVTLRMFSSASRQGPRDRSSSTWAIPRGRPSKSMLAAGG